MKYLITGATGFIGQHRVRHLQKQGHTVIAVGSTHKTNVSNIEAFVDIAEKDSIKYLVARELPDRIEHYASVAVVAVSRSDPYTTYRTNVLGALSVLETAKFYHTPIMIFTTDKYYGSLPKAKENDRPSITSGAYETSKTLQDIVAQSYREAGASVTIIRSCNVFGPDDQNRRIIPNSIRTLQEGKQPIVFTNIRGIRQYVYITDLLRAIDYIWEKAPNNTFNVGTDIHLSQKEVVEIICKAWNLKHNQDIKPLYKAGVDIKEIPEQYLDWTKLHYLDWHPTYTMDEALEEMI